MSDKEKYLGTVSIAQNLVAYFRDSHYELRQKDNYCYLIYDEVLGMLDRLPLLLMTPQAISVKRFVIEPKSLKALWNTMLAYVRLVGGNTDALEAILIQLCEREQRRQEGWTPESMQPLEGDDL